VSTFPVEARPAADGALDIYVDITTTLNGVTPS
jgi:3-phenylpropionate/trans-cinnamate dioxygenase ferredoxin subunit